MRGKIEELCAAEHLVVAPLASRHLWWGRGKKAKWQKENGKMSKCQNVEKAKWQNGRVAKRQNGKVAKCQNVKIARQNVEKAKRQKDRHLSKLSTVIE